MKQTFKTKLESPAVYVYGLDEWDSIKSVITWSVDIDIRTWGINSIMYSFDDIDLQIIDEDGNEVNIDTSKFATSIAPNTDHNMIQVTACDIDLRDNTITVY